MPVPPPPSERRWWQRRGPSTAVFVVVLAVVGIITVAVAGEVAGVLPEVGKDQLGGDGWQAPLGLERVEQLQLAHIPNCATGQITGIVLWDADSEPYWEVTGPPTAFPSFVVGVTPNGFTEVTPYRAPRGDEVVRLVVFRRSGGPIGIRYRADQLRVGRVVSGNPLQRFTGSGFQTADVCGDAKAIGSDDGSTGSTTTTTAPA